jgi:hypothetical protein
MGLKGRYPNRRNAGPPSDAGIIPADHRFVFDTQNRDQGGREVQPLSVPVLGLAIKSYQAQQLSGSFHRVRR